MIGSVSAPGKLMIAGEYVVLDGAEALVAAVEARVFASWSAVGSDGSPEQTGRSPRRAGLPPEAVLAIEHAERELGPVPMVLNVDTSALRSGDRKLGLGSSAAAAAACAGAVVAFHGGDVAAERRRILRWALDGHRAIAPQGSGADVAAATLGGVVRFRPGSVEDATSVEWPQAIHVEVVWTGEPARTSDLVAKVRALASADPARYARSADPLRDAAARLIEAVLAGDARSAVQAAGDHGRAMGALGDAAGAGIVTEPLARAAALAERHGGSAKPSGAGGGDVALAFFADTEQAARFRADCPGADLTLLSLAIGAQGARQEKNSL